MRHSAVEGAVKGAVGGQHYASQLRKSFVLRVPNVIVTRTLAEKLSVDFLTLPYLDYTV